MISFDTLVWFFFRCIDLAVIVAIGWYLLVRQLLPALRKRREHEAYMRNQLEQQMQTRQAQVVARQDEIAQQELYVQMLKEKLAAWAQAVADRQETAAERFKQLQALQHERVQLQQQALEHKKLSEHVVPRAYAQARNELIAHYAQTSEAQAYTEHIIKMMQERS